VEELKASTQKHSESLCSYIQHWSTIKNSAENISNEWAVEAFVTGLRRPEFIENMGCIKPRSVSELMDIANPDDKDAYHNKRTRSPENNHSNRYNN
jgi:hypothetical protein